MLDNLDLSLLCALMEHGGYGTIATILPDATKEHRNICNYRLRRMERFGLVSRVMAPTAKRQWQYFVNVDSVKLANDASLISGSVGYSLGDVMIVDCDDVVYLHRHALHMNEKRSSLPEGANNIDS